MVSALVALIVIVAAVWLAARLRAAAIRRVRGATRQTVKRFGARLERYKLISRRAVRADLVDDPAIAAAMAQYRLTHGAGELDVRVIVEQYLAEIVPFFNVLSYYGVGYTVARAVLRLLYRVSSDYQDRDALDAIPRGDVVVYVMNHRSNADYVVVAFVLARAVSISYAVGEWARIWPLEYVFKSFGAYFIRRRYREPLYHTVLERYVQLITRNGVTQGIFLEGGLSRDGKPQPPKLGLLDYIARTLRDPGFQRDIWLVPVALNYDRVLEDRSLIRELLDRNTRPSRARQLASVTRYLVLNLMRAATGRLRRYGGAAVNFGTPVSLRRWSAQHPHVLDLPRKERLSELDGLARDLMARVADIIPVTPVPLVAAALLSFGRDWVRRDELLDRLDWYRDHLIQRNAQLVHADRGVLAILDSAWPTLHMRRLALAEGGAFLIFPSQRPLLEFYANSVAHLLPPAPPSGGHPAHEQDHTLPTLLPRAT